MDERTKQEEINYHLHKINLTDGTVFYCNDHFLENLYKEILQNIKTNI